MDSGYPVAKLVPRLAQAEAGSLKAEAFDRKQLGSRTWPLAPEGMQRCQPGLRLETMHKETWRRERSRKGRRGVEAEAKRGAEACWLS